MTVRPIDAIGMTVRDLSPRPYSIGQLFEHLGSRVPIDAGVCDTDTLLEACRSFWRDFLVAFVDIRFDHDADNGGLALAELVPYCLCYLRLVLMILQGVAYTKLATKINTGRLALLTM